MTDPFKPPRQLTCPHGRYWASCWCRQPSVWPSRRAHILVNENPEPRLTEARMLFEARTLALQLGSDERTNLLGDQHRLQPEGSPP